MSKEYAILLKCAVLLLSFCVPGCASVARSGDLEKQIIELKGTLVSREQEIQACQGSLNAEKQQLVEKSMQLDEKERQLAEKDLKIKELKKKLEGFGVF
jgi:septal ring factor EnvC (AmiA/AmiB activator)